MNAYNKGVITYNVMSIKTNVTKITVRSQTTSDDLLNETSTTWSHSLLLFSSLQYGFKLIIK